MGRKSGEASSGDGVVDLSAVFGIVDTLCQTESNHKRALHRRVDA